MAYCVMSLVFTPAAAVTSPCSSCSSRHVASKYLRTKTRFGCFVIVNTLSSFVRSLIHLLVLHLNFSFVVSVGLRQLVGLLTSILLIRITV